MELKEHIRNMTIEAIKSQIDGNVGSPGKIVFQNSIGEELARAYFAPTSMVVHRGKGTFFNISPYLRGTVTTAGYANRWSIQDANNTPLISGTCGDQQHLDKDIIFNTEDLHWYLNDVIVIEELTIEIPAGNNDYIALKKD